MRTIAQVAKDIKKDWANVNYAAKPYLQAMLCQDYGFDGERSIVAYFLSNATTYRGENARAYKAELKKIAGIR